MMKYKVGTRESKLAITQAELVCQELVKANSALSIDQFELVKIKTIGDKIQNKNLSEIGGKNLFIKEIEEALLRGDVNFAVHSLKDMTANLNPNLTIAACLEREDPRDAFVSLKYKNLDELPNGALIGTSSIRRKSLALNYRPDLLTIPFRGNVLTRMQKLKQNKVDATFLAVSGLKRLGIDPMLYHPLYINYFLPSISQGIIAAECRADDQEIIKLLSSINHLETSICTQAERAFLEYMDADCSVPIAAYATKLNQQIQMDTLVVDNVGKIHKYSLVGDISQAKQLGVLAGEKLKGYL